MSRTLSAALSWISSFAVAYLVGSKLRGRRTGLLAGLGAGTFAAVTSWVAYGVAETADRRWVTDPDREPAADGR